MKLIFMPATKDHGWYFKDADGRVVMAQGQPVPLAVAEELAEELDKPRWLSWSRDFCPTVDDLFVDVILRDGQFLYHQRAGDCDWRRCNGADGMQDIVLFRRSVGEPKMYDTNGWHDIDTAQMEKTCQAGKIEWPDESDYDPTRVMGGVHNPAKVTTDGVEP